MTTVKDRLIDEQAFHDLQARSRALSFAARQAALEFKDDQYLDHETWVRFAFLRLGDLKAKSILDLGCGHGMAAVVFARQGAEVTALDLSPAYLQEARNRADANRVKVRFVQSTGERIPFATESFDKIWGSAILHHLDLGLAVPEINRLLRPGGIAVFCEPWGENPLLRFARRRLPYPGKARTTGEEPLRLKDIKLLKNVFPNVELQGFQLLGMASRIVRAGPIIAGLQWCDRVVLSKIPSLGHFCRYVVITLQH